MIRTGPTPADDSGALVSEAYRRGFVTDALEETSVMGVHFESGRAFPFDRAILGAIGDTLHPSVLDATVEQALARRQSASGLSSTGGRRSNES